MKTVLCYRCGESFQISGRYAKYCPTCKPIAYAAKRQENAERISAREREETRRKMLLMQDSYIQICLNCVKPMCSGNCKLLPDYHGSK